MDCREGHGTAEEQADLYSKEYAMFWNNADIQAMTQLAHALQHANLCNRDHVVLIGGVNEGQLAEKLLQQCGITVHGVEIQEPLVKVARERLEAFKSATVHHLGWSNSMQKGVRVAALGGYGGLYSTEQLAAAKRDNGRPHILSAMASSAMQQEVVSGIEGGQTDTMPISVWARDTLALSRVIYVAIDAEGHEAHIIEGMALEDVSNRRRFAAFQFELGGTWAERDPRKAHPSWSQEQVAGYLSSLNYDLYLIGAGVYLPVDAGMLKLAAMFDEGFGPFVQGNMLALHRAFAHPAMHALVKSRKMLPRPDLCSQLPQPQR